jgi:glycosyltransferase involved in cell wall biosynthesis
MQVLFIFPGSLYPPSGDSIRSQDIAEKLAKSGSKVEFYCFGKGPGFRSDKKNISFLELFTYEGILARKMLKSSIFRNNLLKLASVMAISYDFLPQGIASLSPFLPLYLYDQLTENDLIWVEGGFGNPFLVLFSRLLRKPFIFSYYGGKRIGLRQRLLQKVIQLTCVLSNVVVTTSESEKEHISSQLNLPSSKLVALPDSVDKKFLERPTASVRELYRLDGKIVILFMGNLSGTHNFLAVKQIMDTYIPYLQQNLKNCNFHFLVVGPKPSNFPYNSTPFITFVGYAVNPQDYVYASDICLAPVYGIGGLHVKILAYMACGKPIITSTEGAKPLGLRNRDDALIAGDEADFASKILELINDEKLRRHLSANSKQYIQTMEAEIDEDFSKLQKLLNYLVDEK